MDLEIMEDYGPERLIFVSISRKARDKGSESFPTEIYFE
jgi:hypothetical protein